MLVHKFSLAAVRAEDFSDDSSNPQNSQSNNILNVTDMNNSKDPITDLIDWMQKYSKVVRSLKPNQLLPSIPKTVSFFNDFQNVSINSWIPPKADTEGISGYFCQYCRTFSSRFIRDVGYDKTERQKHIDFYNHVGDVGDDFALDNMAVNKLTDALNFFIPGIKYLLSFDLTDFFMELMKVHNIKGVLQVIGIPNRWYLIPVKENLQWFQKVMANVGNKVRVESAEVTDFLRRAQASYAIFQTVTGTSLKWFAIWITE